MNLGRFLVILGGGFCPGGNLTLLQSTASLLNMSEANCTLLCPCLQLDYLISIVLLLGVSAGVLGVPTLFLLCKAYIHIDGTEEYLSLPCGEVMISLFLDMES